MLYQQGDVLLERINDDVEKMDFSYGYPRPKNVKRTHRGFVLAEGETTGHAHVIEEEIILKEVGDTLYIGAKDDFIVKHEEHKAIKVPKGNYRVRKVQEYDHFKEESRRVVD